MIFTGTFKDRTWTRKYLTKTAMDNRQSKDILILTLRCNKSSAYTERPTPPLVKEVAPLVNTYVCRRRKNLGHGFP
jgi:hypothetical protein